MTFAQEIYKAASEAADSEVGRLEISPLSKEQILVVVGGLTRALDELPPETNMHAVMFALTFIRNAILTAMMENQKHMVDGVAGSA